MTAGTTFFSTLVIVALAVTVAAPVILLVLLFIDWKRGNLW
jgi:hypothetical protein